MGEFEFMLVGEGSPLPKILQKKLFEITGGETPPLQSFFYPINNAERAARSPHLMVGVGALDDPKTMGFPLGIVLLMRLYFLPVGGDVLCQEQDCKQLCKRIVYTFYVQSLRIWKPNEA